MALNNGMMTSDSPEWYTPTCIIDRVVETLGTITLDPCSNSRTEPNVPALKHYTKEDDGLNKRWLGSVFVNPPYGKTIGQWVSKAYVEHTLGHAHEIILLLPARTDTRWWQIIAPYPVCFIRGRLKFTTPDKERKTTTATFPSAVVYLGKNIKAFDRAFRDMGTIYEFRKIDLKLNYSNGANQLVVANSD